MSKKDSCFYCGGKGYVTMSHQYSDGGFIEETEVVGECPECNGTGEGDSEYKDSKEEVKDNE